MRIKSFRNELFRFLPDICIVLKLGNVNNDGRVRPEGIFSDLNCLCNLSGRGITIWWILPQDLFDAQTSVVEFSKVLKR